MDLVDLRLFAAAADAGTFARAAKAFGLATSTVSRRVTRLEDELGFTMFERGSFGLRLTSSGRLSLRRVRRVLENIDAIVRFGKKLEVAGHGEIELGVRMPPVGEPIRSLLAEWHSRYPDIGVRLSEMPDAELRLAVEDRRLDVVLMARYALWPDAASEPICRERLYVALPLSHSLSDREGISWAELSGETILVQDWNDSHATRDYYASLLADTINLSPHAAGKQSLFGLVSAGFGITLATHSQAQVSFPGILFRPVMEENAWVETDLAWNPQSEEAVVGRFVAFMRDEARLRKLF